MPKVKLNPKKQMNYSEFKKAISAKNSISALDAIVNKLTVFEKKYNMKSSVFYEKYRKGQMPDEHEFSVWACAFGVYMSLGNARGELFE